MFQELQPLLATVASLTISMVENTDGTITLTVLPVGVKKGSKLDSQMQLVGTAAELDEGFAAHLNSYTTMRQSLADQLAATEAILEAQKKEAAETAKKTIAKSSKTESGSNQDSDDDEQSGDDENGAGKTASGSSETSASTAPAAQAPSALWD
jgi:PRTRC genetic system protein E